MSDEIVLRTASVPELRGEFAPEFLQGMVNRMIVSFHKYGPIREAYPEELSALGSLAGRMQLYQETGNTEYLIDVANFAMIEFMHPSHPKAHFDPEGRSPGRIRRSGRVTDKANLDL